jgi:hypothetical protein
VRFEKVRSSRVQNQAAIDILDDYRLTCEQPDDSVDVGHNPQERCYLQMPPENHLILDLYYCQK